MLFDNKETDMDHITTFLMEIEKLKNVTRKTYLSSGERLENSAEHSWHLALAILAFGKDLVPDLDLLQALKIALVHDIGEIGAGDVSIYSPSHESQAIIEEQYLERLETEQIYFSKKILTLWREYQAQQTNESKLVKVFDRFLPFLSNINTEGRSWMDQGISAGQVKEINKIIKSEAPDLFSWMEEQILNAITRGWLKE